MILKYGTNDLLILKGEGQEVGVLSELSKIGTVRVIMVTGDVVNQTTEIADGQSETILFVNDTNLNCNVTVSVDYKTPNGEQIALVCPVGGYCEVSFININDTIYARGI